MVCLVRLEDAFACFVWSSCGRSWFRYPERDQRSAGALVGKQPHLATPSGARASSRCFTNVRQVVCAIIVVQGEARYFFGPVAPPRAAGGSWFRRLGNGSNL